jgi:putative transposase
MFEGAPFHVTHRGNNQNTVFRNDADRRRYLDVLHRYARQFGMAVWGYCLMRNHVHLIVAGATSHSIPRAVGNAHRDYSRSKNVRTATTGHTWANRYFSSLLDEPHLWAAIRYVELNPVRAGLVERATDFAWSSARRHAGLDRDPLLADDDPFPGAIQDWCEWLAIGVEDGILKRIRENTAKGFPTGNESFISAVERRTGRRLRSLRHRTALVR